MLNSIEIIVSFLWSAGLLAAAWMIGHLACKLLAPGLQPGFYHKSFAGFFTAVSIYALWQTGFLSILLPVPVLALLHFRYLRKAALPPAPGPSDGMQFLVLLPLVFLVFLFIFTTGDGNSLKYISGDFNIYYRMAERLNRYGVESYNFNIDLGTLNRATPYHFGDLWVYALVGRLCGHQPHMTFLISFTVVSVIFISGLYSLCIQVFGAAAAKVKYLFLLSFAGLFSGLAFCFPSFLHMDVYTFSVFNWGKIIVLSSAMIGIVLSVSRQDMVNMLLFTLITGFLYINAIPAVFAAVFLYLLILLWRKRLTFRKWFSYVSLYAGVLLLYVLVFYKLLPLLLHQPKNSSEVLLSMEAFSNPRYFKTMINIVLGSTFQLFTLLPYFVVLLVGLFLLYRNKALSQLFRWQDTVLFVALIFLCGQLTWGVTHPLVVDTVQFFHNITAPVYAIAIALILMFVIIKVRKPVLTVITLAICALSAFISIRDVFYTSTFDRKEWASLSTFLEKDREYRTFVNFRAMKNYGGWSNNKTDQYIPLGILVYKWPDYQNYSLLTPFYPIRDSSYLHEKLNDIRSASYSMYYKAHKAQGLSDEAVTTQFLKDYKVGFITVSDDTLLPDYLRINVIDSLKLAKSELTLYRLTPKL